MASFASPLPVWGLWTDPRWRHGERPAGGRPHPLPLLGWRLQPASSPRPCLRWQILHLRGPLGPRNGRSGVGLPGRPVPPPPTPCPRAPPPLRVAQAPGPARLSPALRGQRAPAASAPRAGASSLAFFHFLKDNSSNFTGIGHGFPWRFWLILRPSSSCFPLYFFLQKSLFLLSGFPYFPPHPPRFWSGS